MKSAGLGRSMGSYNQPNEGKTNDWLSPPSIVEACGPFDLDPCASIDMPWKTAKEMWTSGGMERKWKGSVWLNPPYGPHAEKWLHRLAEHGKGIALVFARTETKWFWKTVWKRATAVLFLRNRIHFHYPITGFKARFNSGAPSVLVAYGSAMSKRLNLLHNREIGFKVTCN